MVDQNERLGEFMLDKGIISRRQLEQAVDERTETGAPLGEILLQLGFISRADLDEFDRECERERLLEQLQLMFDMEMVFSDFYYMCAEHYPAAADFWKSMGDDEVRHTLAIGKIIEGIYRDPKAYELGYGASLAEIERVIGLVREAYMRVKKDRLPLDKVLIMTHNFESAMMESRVFEVISTGTKEARELLDSIYLETQQHMQKIMQAYSAT